MKPVRYAVFLFCKKLEGIYSNSFYISSFFKVFETLFIRSRQQFYRL